MIRMAINAFNPDVPADINESELLDLLSAKVKEAIANTELTRKCLNKTLALLGKR